MRFSFDGCCATAPRIVGASIRPAMNSRRLIDRAPCVTRRFRLQAATTLSGIPIVREANCENSINLSDLAAKTGCPRWVLCHEYCRSTRRVRNCTKDEGRPFEVGNQVLTLSHRKLLSSKAMVVDVAETPGQESGRQG